MRCLDGSGSDLGHAVAERSIERAAGRSDVAPLSVGPPVHVLVVHTGQSANLRWSADGTPRQERFHAGEALVNPAGWAARPRWQDDVELLLLGIDPAWLEKLAAESGAPGQVELVPRFHFSDPLLKMLLERLVAEYSGPGPADSLYAQSLVQAAAAVMLRVAAGGRPLAAALTDSGTEGAWEITHLGGHRFSPTLLVLPYGYAYGRMETPAVKEILDAARAGRVRAEGCRGNSAWERPGQAAELAVREATGEDAADALRVVATDKAARADGASGAGRAEGAGRADGAGGTGRAGGETTHWEVTVAHVDGRRWRVTVAQEASLPPRPESCGAALGSPARMDVVAVRPLPENADGPTYEIPATVTSK
nr:hypothetical protein [Streptomyces sp. SID337]